MPPRMSECSVRELRVGSLNVHGWKDASSKDNQARVERLIAQSNADLVGLQEVKGLGAARSIAKALGWHLSLDCPTTIVGCNTTQHHPARKPRPAKHGRHSAVHKDSKPSGERGAKAIAVMERNDVFSWGCVLLSRFPITGVQVVVGREAHRARGMGTQRLVCCDVQLPGHSRLRVSVVHLDHISEVRRGVQARALLTQVAPGLDATPHVWVGDFNALAREDYTEAEWQHIGEVRAKSDWEVPVSDLTQMLEEEVGMEDCWKTAPCKTGKLGTCRFDTRIDYVWRNGAMGLGWALRGCAHVRTNATDHDLVVAHFAKPSP